MCRRSAPSCATSRPRHVVHRWTIAPPGPGARPAQQRQLQQRRSRRPQGRRRADRHAWRLVSLSLLKFKQFCGARLAVLHRSAAPCGALLRAHPAASSCAEPNARDDPDAGGGPGGRTAGRAEAWRAGSGRLAGRERANRRQQGGAEPIIMRRHNPMRAAWLPPCLPLFQNGPIVASWPLPAWIRFARGRALPRAAPPAGRCFFTSAVVAELVDAQR